MGVDPGQHEATQRIARRMPARGWALLLAAGCQLAGAAPTGDIGLAQFGLQRWDEADGLGGNWVRGLVEAPDGRVWIGTSRGLARFDGRVFTPIATGAPGQSPPGAVAALAAARDGAVWVGLVHGGVLKVRRDGSPGAVAASLPAAADVFDLREDAHGRLWIATSLGLWRLDGGRLDNVAPGPAARSAPVRSLALDSAGVIWARSVDHGLWRIDGAGVGVVADAPRCAGYGIAVGPTQERFTSCREGVWRWPAGASAWQRISDAFGVGPIHLDRRGDLWFSTRDGLTRWSDGAVDVLAPEQGLGDWRVRAITEDRVGNLWIGTFAGGLARLHRGPVQSVGAPEGVAIEGTTAVLAAPDGDIWVGALHAGLLRIRPGHGVVRHWTAAHGLPGDTAWALADDLRRPGALWVGGDAGLAWLADGRLHPTGPDGESHAGPVRLVHVDADDPETVWVAGPEGGAVALRGRQAVRHDAAHGLPLDRVRLMTRDPDGRLLAGGDAGLFERRAGRWAPYRPGGLQAESLTAATWDTTGNLWLASDSLGLLFVAGDAHSRWSLEQGLPFWPVHSLAVDREGSLWLSGNEGLARIRLDDHARWRTGESSDIPVERLGRRDGLRDQETNGWGHPAHAALGDGRLVYPTLRGVAVLDPAALPSVGLSPPDIYLRAGWAGRRALDLKSPLVLSREERVLRIAFSAVEMMRPEAVKFRYRLDGLDRDWVAAGRDAEASWSGLPAGEFAFRLQARLPGQPWIDAGPPLPVSVAPQPWESTPLRLAALALVLLLAAAAVRWRMNIQGRHAAVLRRARTFLREVIDTSPNPIFVRNRDGAYTLANHAAAEIYRRTPDALEGHQPHELGPSPSGMSGIEALDAEVIASGQERVVAEREIVDGDGQRRWFRVVKRPGFGPDGRTVEQVIGTAVDVTDFKQAADSLEREKTRLRRSREEARALSHQLLRAQEDERQRLARDIHDDLTQQLAGLSMLAWSTAQASARDPGVDRREAMEHLARGLEQLANDVQALSRELHPPALEALGLAEALRAECTTFSQRTGLAICCDADPQAVEPPAQVGLALYRIAQEALRNALAHAQADRLTVTLVGSDTGLRLQVADDGIGFDAERAGGQPGIGLSGMRERARLAGATLRIDSGPGRGTRIVVEWRNRTGRRKRASEPD